MREEKSHIDAELRSLNYQGTPAWEHRERCDFAACFSLQLLTLCCRSEQVIDKMFICITIVSVLSKGIGPIAY